MVESSTTRTQPRATKEVLLYGLYVLYITFAEDGLSVVGEMFVFLMLTEILPQSEPDLEHFYCTAMHCHLHQHLFFLIQLRYLCRAHEQTAVKAQNEHARDHKGLTYFLIMEHAMSDAHTVIHLTAGVLFSCTIDMWHNSNSMQREALITVRNKKKKDRLAQG